MKVYSLVKNYCSDKVKYNIGHFLGDGLDGEVYSLSDNKVIKFSVIYDLNFSKKLDVKYQEIHKKFSFIKDNRIKIFPTIYDFNFLYCGYRDHVDGKQQFLLHYYVMDKMIKLSEDEKKVMHTVFCHEDLNKNKHVSKQQLEKILSGLSRGLDFNKDEVILFESEIKKTKLLHADLHVRNIMKNNCGNFKLIDLDRLEWRA